MNKKKDLRIGVDCRLSGNKHAGIGRYIEELIIRLPKLSPNVTWIFFFYSNEQADSFLSKAKFSKAESTRVEIVIANVKHYTLAEQLKLPSIFSKAKLDLLHVPHFNIPFFYSGKIVVTIHDLLWHEFRGLNVTTLNPVKYLLKYLAYKFITRRAIKQATYVLVPAQTIKTTITNHYPMAKKKIVVTKEGANQLFKPVPNKTNHNKDLIYVGSLYPHKNIGVVLKAIKNLPDYSLKLIGSRTIFHDRTKSLIDKYQVKDQVKFTGYLEDHKLNKLLQSSFALIQPSLSEGFGLTGVEAMASGVPVIASDIPIFKEIYQDGATYFDPKSSNDFVQSVSRLEKENRQKIVQQGLKVAQQYSWDKMAKETLKIYETSLRPK